MNGFCHTIYQWYNKYKRDLPWRNTSDPYKIWVSEIILQQTRVAQGTSYYLRFTERFPSLKHLAEANEDEILKLWQGLGYYSRARNLHATAKVIVNNYQAEFPATYKDIIKLKGIGEYTAAAIASIAFNLPYPTVDGNVYRIFSRYFGIETPIDTAEGKKQFLELANELVSKDQPGMHNQAVMEFGALQCTPKSPDCPNCPLVLSCFAYNNKCIEKLPCKSKKVKTRNRYFYYYLIDTGKHIYLNKRTSDDIWKNLYELPLMESYKAIPEKELMQQKIPFIENTNYNLKQLSKIKTHKLSHQTLSARLIHIEVFQPENISSSLIRVNKKDIYKFAVPKLLETFFEEFHLVDKKNK